MNSETIKLRRYEEIWAQLKKSDSVSVEISHPFFLSRMKRGVFKEKDNDLGFKILNVDNYRIHCEYDEEKKVITFSLTNKLGMAPKVINGRSNTTK